MYKDLKVTSGEVAANNVKSAPDRLQGTATENKNVFDKLVELFVGKYNDLLDELDDNEIKAIDPITISGYTISHANSGVTQGMYGTDQEQDPQHGEKFIVPYIIVDEHGHIVSAGNSEVQLPSGGGGGTSDYDDLTDKPSINSVTLSGNKSASDLSLASASHSHTKSDISDFPSLATVATTGDYDDLSDKPSIPTKTSDLTNDSGFSSVSFTRYTTSGTNIADIDIDGTTTKIYAPSSGGGGVTDYDQLTSRPQVNSVTLTGNKSSSDLGVADEVHTHTKSDITDFPSLATVATTGDYDDLSDKPTIPTKVSDLNNDSGFISSETDPVYSASAASGITSSDISAWNGKSTVSLNRKTTSGTNIADLTINGTTTQLYAPTGGGGGGTITEVKTTAGTHQTIDVTSGTAQFAVPTDTNHLTNGAGFISTETDPVFSASAAAGITSSDISTWNGKSDFSGDYNDLTNKPTIPTKTSDLNNDSGFVSGTGFYQIVQLAVTTTSSVSAHSSYANATYTVPAGDRPSGMTLVGMVGFGASNPRLTPSTVFVNGAHSISVTLANTSASSVSSGATVNFRLLYIKATSA